MKIAAILSDPGYSQLKTYVIDHTGLHYYSDKDEDFAARLLRRMTARAARDCSSYLAMLAARGGAKAEIEALIGELTIGETYFFRQHEQFDLLRRRIIPDLLQQNALSRRLKIWSAGCATGAEAYSIAVLLQLEFGAVLEGWNVSILGTDINAEFLDKARSGVFGAWALRALPEKFKGIFSEETGRHRQLRPRYRQNVSFEYHNLVGLMPFPGSSGDPFDLILCRNVLIYFSRERMQEVASRLQGSLREGGWLLVGYAEASADIFSTLTLADDPGSAAYRRLTSPPPVTLKPQRSAFELESLPQWPGSQKSAPLSAVIGPHQQPEIPAPTPSATIEDARLVANSGDFESAMDICTRWIESDPLQAPAHLTLGLILEHESSPVEAQSAFRRAIYLDRSLALAHYHLGASLQRMGSPKAAQKSFDNVINLLEHRAEDEPAPEGDGMTVGELRDLTRMHLVLISESRKKA